MFVIETPGGGGYGAALRRVAGRRLTSRALADVFLRVLVSVLVGAALAAAWLGAAAGSGTCPRGNRRLASDRLGRSGAHRRPDPPANCCRSRC